jgi:ketosteroid isomerase-like protein
MSTDTNMTLVRRYYAECANDPSPNKQQGLMVVDHLLSPDFAMAYNNDIDDKVAHGRDRHKAFLIDHARTFPGEHWTVERMIADEQTVACRWRVQATHAETGNPMDLRGADFFTIAHGQLAELHRFLDVQTLMQQMQSRLASDEASA